VTCSRLYVLFRLFLERKVGHTGQFLLQVTYDITIEIATTQTKPAYQGLKDCAGKKCCISYEELLLRFDGHLHRNSGIHWYFALIIRHFHTPLHVGSCRYIRAGW
jgi:hypothetical protein